MKIDNKEKTLPLLLKIIILNLPLFSLVIIRYLWSVEFTALTSVYVFSVLLGYYFLVPLILILPALLLSFFRKISLTFAFLVLTFLLYYFLLDSVVYDIYKFHINLFFIELFFIDFGGYGFTSGMIFLAIGVLMVLAFLEYGVFKLAKKVNNIYLLLIIPIVFLYVFSQLIHIYAFANDRGDITNITVRMPLYFPIQSSEIATKHQKLGSSLGLENNPNLVKTASISYPRKEFKTSLENKDSLPNVIFIVLESWRFDALDSLVCPNIYSFSKKSTVALNHFSSGNVTTTGLFGMFYGLHSTYWEVVIANNTVIDNPVFIDILNENNYDFGVFSNSGFDRLKISSTIFNDINIHKDFIGKYEWQKDRDKNNKFIKFLENRNINDKPFFGFIFYKSTHNSYYFPEEHNIFTPTKNINLGLVNNGTDPTPFLNAYKNSIHYVDELVSDVLESLKKSNLDKNTVIVLTSDHGEEFNDNKGNYWGHGSNFTKYQSKVPLIMYFPDKEPNIINFSTSHIDIVPTLLEESFNIKSKSELYCNGKNIFNLDDNIRPFVVSSYVNYGLILGDNVYAVYPFALKKYKLDDVKKKIDNTDKNIFRKAVDEMNLFYK